MLVGKFTNLEGATYLPTAYQDYSLAFDVDVLIPVCTVAHDSFELFSSWHVWPCPVIQVASSIDQDCAVILEAFSGGGVDHFNIPLPASLIPFRLLNQVTKFDVLV